MPMTPFERSVLNVLYVRLRARHIPAKAMAAFVAQVSVETANGTSRNVRVRRNFAGIRGARRTPTNTRGYRTYPSDIAGLEAYLQLINDHYARWFTAAQLGDPYQVAVAMGKSPWAATHYRLHADGTDDKSGDAGKVLGTVGTEGQALWPTIRRILADPHYPLT